MLPEVVNRPDLERFSVRHNRIDGDCIICARKLVPVGPFGDNDRDAQSFIKLAGKCDLGFHLVAPLPPKSHARCAIP